MTVRETATLMALIIGAGDAKSKESSVTSPNGALRAVVLLTEAGEPRYSLSRNGQTVLANCKLGLVRDDVDFTRGLKATGTDAPRQVVDEYDILTAKRRKNRHVANEATFHFAAAGGQQLDVIFHAANDGVAFRYHMPEVDATPRRIRSEASSFRFPAGTRAWLQPMSVAKTGYEQSNPSYEEYYEQDIAAGTSSPRGAGWVFPALFRTEESGTNDGDATWVLVSEAGLGRSYCGSRLASESPDGEYTIGFPDPREVFPGGPAFPASTLPWSTPWRVIVVGSLGTIAESMLGVDLADPAQGDADVAELPGKAAWSWCLLKDDNTVFAVQKQFIDYAHDMQWQYCLVDADWDRKIGEEKLAELVDYGRQQGVKIIVWYNSAGSWNTTPYTPRGKLLTHDARLAEFEKLKKIGVAGLKIDFFGGDGQSMIAYYHDILADAAPFRFAINFHGATLPRGWQRTYPHLMTMEAIRGMEFATFEQSSADRSPSHNTMLPFTRNVFDPMDYTPVVLDQVPGIKRRTTPAHELALSVLFTSGVQHYAEIPAGMAKQPDFVREFLKHVPAVWDDVKFLAGEPGKFVVLARRAGDRWYVAGINGEAGERTVDLSLCELAKGAGGRGELIADGVDRTGGADGARFRQETVTVTNSPHRIQLPPYGGFVVTLAPADK